jgi:transcriptional regulator with XRE-family HTH domain
VVDKQRIIDLEVGERIKFVRNHQKRPPGRKPMSLRELSALAGISFPTLQAMERGRIHIDARSLKRIARALQVDVSALRGETRLNVPTAVSKSGTIRNRRQVIFYSKLVIFSLEDALGSIDNRHHNNPPSDLIVDDAAYIEQLRTLVFELKRLNDLLENQTTTQRITKKPIIDAKKHLNNFLSRWAGTVGVGTGIMTLGAMAALLHQLGASDIIFEQLQKRLPIR